MRTKQNSDRKYRVRPPKSTVKQLSLGLLITDPDEHRRLSAVKQRTCLSCSRSFRSEGPGNRICTACKGLESWTSPGAFTIHAAF